MKEIKIIENIQITYDKQTAYRLAQEIEELTKGTIVSNELCELIEDLTWNEVE